MKSKILNYFHKITLEKIFAMNNETVSRGNYIKLKGQKCVRKSFFNVPIVGRWNTIPASVDGSETTDSFKFRLDKYFETHDVINNKQREDITP